MMKTRWIALLLGLLLLPAASLAQEQAFTNRATELRDRAGLDGRPLATLPENTEVKVLGRGGGWTRVQAASQVGWVRVFHLRFPAVAVTSSSSGGFGSGLASALGFGRQRSQQATIATTGIRGLSPEDLKNASPDGEALRRMQSYRADRSGAERFAREARLAAVAVDSPDETSGGRRR